MDGFVGAWVNGLRGSVTRPLKRFYFSAMSAAILYTTCIYIVNVSFLHTDFHFSRFRENDK